MFPVSQVKEYRQLTIQNLQLALYHSTKEDLLKVCEAHVTAKGTKLQAEQ